jgi:hypothetical protein
LGGGRGYLVVCVADEVEAAYGEDDLVALAVEVDDVGRAVGADVGVGGALDDAVGVEVGVAAAGRRELGVGEVVLVDGHDDVADARDGLEVVGGGGRPRLAVVGADVGEPLPRPPHAPHAQHALQPARHRHGRRLAAARRRLVCPGLVRWLRGQVRLASLRPPPLAGSGWLLLWAFFNWIACLDCSGNDELDGAVVGWGRSD